MDQEHSSFDWDDEDGCWPWLKLTRLWTVFSRKFGDQKRVVAKQHTNAADTVCQSQIDTSASTSAAQQVFTETNFPKGIENVMSPNQDGTTRSCDHESINNSSIGRKVPQNTPWLCRSSLDHTPDISTRYLEYFPASKITRMSFYSKEKE